MARQSGWSRLLIREWWSWKKEQSPPRWHGFCSTIEHHHMPLPGTPPLSSCLVGGSGRVLRICCCCCMVSHCLTIFLAFFKVNSGCKHSYLYSALSQIPRTMRSRMRPLVQLSAKLYRDCWWIGLLTCHLIVCANWIACIWRCHSSWLRIRHQTWWLLQASSDLCRRCEYVL